MNLAYQRIIAASDDDCRDLFVAAARRIGTTEQNVEKDFWVCWTLDALFHRLPAGGPRLLFKGGTSLSKAFGVISRFSEDIDVTVFRSDLGESASLEELEGLSGKKRRTRLDAIKAACQAYIDDHLQPRLDAVLAGDLAEDPARVYDLAGGITLSKTLFAEEIVTPAIISYSTDQNTIDPKLELLEAPAPRVRVRQEAFYQEYGGTNILAGLKGIGDYSVYPSGRMALRWNRQAMSAVSYDTDSLYHVAHFASPPLDSWTWYSEAGPGPLGPAGADFHLAQNEAPGARTDFLHVLFQDWVVATQTVGAFSG